MSTLRATNIKHESSATNQIVLGADGSIGGTLGDTLAAKLDASAYTPGMALITPTSIAYSGGSASSSAGTTTFSGVTSISLNGIFTSAYANYRIVITGSGSLTGSTIPNAFARMRASGTDASGSTYRDQYHFSTGSAGPSKSYTTGAAQWNFGATMMDVGSVTVADIMSPYVSSNTNMLFSSLQHGSANGIYSTGGAIHATASAYDGFTMYQTSGTFTGTVRVYGYEGA